MDTPNFNFGYKTFEQVVQRINDATTMGLEEHTPEYLAAAYAAQAQAETDYELCQESAGFHLEVLINGGAEFNKSEALKLLID